MGRKNRLLSQVKKIQTPSYKKELTFDDINQMERELEIRKGLLIEKGMNSHDPLTIMNTYNYINSRSNGQEQALKSFLINPDLTSLNTQNYRVPNKSVSYETLKRMSRTPIIKSIIGTRVDQVASFSSVSDSETEKGWMIRKKKSIFNKDKNTKPTTEELKVIEYITKFIEDGGEGNNKWNLDSFAEFERQTSLDSLVFDQLCMEIVHTRSGDVSYYQPVDGSTIQIIDDSKDLSQYFSPMRFGKVKYFPKYAQVWQGNVYQVFYPWEMTFGVRNKTTDINSNGYGICELEDLIQIVTYLLYGVQYNGNFFSQGSNPKGFFTIEGALSPNSLADFKQMWRNTIAGVSNSHKIPVIESSNKINWVDMQASNKDMEFNLWMEFLMTVTCAVFKIDPSEVGYNFQQSARIFGQDGQKERLKHSQAKGLVPILKLKEKIYTKYIVERIDPDYEFIYTGIEVEDQVAALDMDTKKVQFGGMSLEDMFEKYSGRKFNPDKDTILNPVYLQLKQMNQMGGDMNWNQEQPPPQEDENPFIKQLVKGIESGLFKRDN